MEIKLVSCPLCTKSNFESVDTLRTTLVTAATAPLCCPVCQEVLHGLDKLTIHLFSHANKEEVCNGNKLKFNKVSLQNLSDVGVATENTEECGKVEQLTEKVETIKDYSTKSTEINKNTEVIVSLDTQYGDASSLHDKPVQNTKKCELFVCEICSFTFSDKKILDMHQNLLHQTCADAETSSRIYHCHLCNKKFKMKGSLMVHLRVAHYGFFSNINAERKNMREGESTEGKDVTKMLNKAQQDNKHWACEVCSKMFTTKYFLKKHKRLHTGEMPYCCNLCNKFFTFQQSYHKHMLYHSSEKPYVCNECGRAFKELSTLQNHARIHSGERPFGCETCGKRFRQRVSYLVHQRIHTGVMPYKCTACDRSFRYKVSQKSHRCPMNPPGSVIKLPDPTDTAVQLTELRKITSQIQSEKCIMSVDYNTGNINFIRNKACMENKHNNKSNTYQNNVDETIDETTINKAEFRETIGISTFLGNSRAISNGAGSKSTRLDQKESFPLQLSPVLTEVEALCLNSNSPVDTNSYMTQNEDSLQMIREKCLEELLNGSSF